VSPVPILSSSSSAALNVTKALSKIKISYDLEGALANPTEELKRWCWEWEMMALNSIAKSPAG
jgi:hypothetical protein